MTKILTCEEKTFVEKYYKELSHEEIGRILGRSRHTIRNLCWTNGWRKRVSYWTKEEIEYLVEGYKRTDDFLEEISSHLKRDKSNVCRKAREFGLTFMNRRKTELHSKKQSESMKEWHKTNEHPRGFAGHHHSKTAKEKISQGSIAYNKRPDCYIKSEFNRQFQSDKLHKMQIEGKMRNGYSKGSMGKRDNLGGLYVRSSWEANYARYLNWLVEQGQISAWKYEADWFEFKDIKRGCRSYLPDFKIFNLDGTIEYHEVKGWMDEKSKTKLKRMAKYYPEVIIVVIGKDEYGALSKSVRAFIPDWEINGKSRKLIHAEELGLCDRIVIVGETATLRP